MSRDIIVANVGFDPDAALTIRNAAIACKHRWRKRKSGAVVCSKCHAHRGNTNAEFVAGVKAALSQRKSK